MASKVSEPAGVSFISSMKMEFIRFFLVFLFGCFVRVFCFGNCRFVITKAGINFLGLIEFVSLIVSVWFLMFNIRLCKLYTEPVI